MLFTVYRYETPIQLLMSGYLKGDTRIYNNPSILQGENPQDHKTSGNILGQNLKEIDKVLDDGISSAKNTNQKKTRNMIRKQVSGEIRATMHQSFHHSTKNQYKSAMYSGFISQDLVLQNEFAGKENLFTKECKKNAFEIIMKFHSNEKIRSKQVLEQTMNQILIMESEEKPGIWTMIKNLFNKELRLAFIVCLMLNLANELTGASYFGYYSKTILTEVGLDGGLWTGISGWVVLLSCFIGLATVEKTGRLTILILGLFFQMMSFYVMSFATYYQWPWTCGITFLFWNMVSYGGLYIVYYAYICETVPPIAIGIGFTFQYGCRTILAEVWPIMMKHMSNSQIFSLFSFVGLLLLIFFF